MMASLALAGMASFAIGCRGGREVEPGHERGDCRPDHSCDVGLLCLSNLCVRPPPADCKDVGEQLASIELGNYAEPETRAPVVARYQAACDAAVMSREEQLCLDRARDRWSAAQCAPRLFPDLAASSAGDCAAIIVRVRTAMQNQASQLGDPQTKAWFDRTMSVMQESCEQDHWPDSLKKCMLAGDGLAALTQACSRQAPPALQQRLQERLNQAMQAAAH
ncbi:MAG TPA: hypothetical protein VHW23_14730 [Kofleriaceae bacterium]|nr:hypothetical protein [Kofleriaceae bacterium]